MYARVHERARARACGRALPDSRALAARLSAADADGDAARSRQTAPASRPRLRDEEVRRQLVDASPRRLEAARERVERVVLPYDGVARLLTTVHSCFNPTNPTELTIERAKYKYSSVARSMR